MDERERELIIYETQALRYTTDTAETIYKEGNLELINILLQLAREVMPYYMNELTKIKAEAAVMREALKYYAAENEDLGYKARAVLQQTHEIAISALSSTAGQDLLNRLSRAEQREKQLREALQQVGELLEGIWIPDSDDWKQYVKACKLIRSVLEGAE